MARAFAEIAFTEAVLAAQRKMGSAQAYAPLLEAGVERGDRLGPQEAGFIAMRDGFYQGSVSSSGWPYIQFRGGPRGFVRALDEKTLAYADFRGNRQYLSLGNLTEEPRVAMFFMDYPNHARLKVWGRARFVDVDEDPALVKSLFPEGYKARPERAVLIEVAAFDWNCPQHIPERLTIEELESVLAPFRDKMAALEAENAELKAKLGAEG